MQGIKNLIARRRPVSDPALDAPLQEAPARDPWDDLAERFEGGQDLRNCDIDSSAVPNQRCEASRKSRHDSKISR